MIFSLYDREEIPRKRSFRKKIRSVLKAMFKTESNLMRPRRIPQESWTKSKSFTIKDIHDYSYNVSEDVSHDSTGKKRGKIKETSKAAAKVFVHQFENYCDKSTLHGLRYVGDRSLSFGERFFWFVAFVSAISFAIYYITNIFDKWNTNPVLIAFSPFDANLDEIPFPSITICNMNQVKKYEAQRVLREGSTAERYLLGTFCNDSASNSSKTEKEFGYESLQNFMIKAGHSCTDMIKSCMWQSDVILCEDFFNNYLTDEGLCCTFNRLPPENLFRNPSDIAQLNQTFPSKIYDWSPEERFPDKNVGDLKVLPIRPVGSGVHLGLSLVVDANVDEYFCSSTDSIGFKMVLSNPSETPRVADYGYLISPGKEVRFVVLPEIQEASRAIRTVPISKRQCFFQNERPLRYYRTYSQRNCNLECQSNYTLQTCKCIPFYLPKSKYVKICGQLDDICSRQAKEDMELIYGSGSSCHCLPGCFETKFDKQSTVSKLYNLHARHELTNLSKEYFTKNMAVLHFYFKETKFRIQVKSEIYGFTEALSNIGGLLGLCLGFSFLSLIELIYYISLKVLCSILHSKRGDSKKKVKTSHNNNLIPFIQ